MRAGIVTALPQETKAILCGLHNIERKSLDGRPYFNCSSGKNQVAVIESGMGICNAESAAEQLVMEGHPELLMSAGLGGGVDSSVTIGDPVFARRILQWHNGKLEEVGFIPFAFTLDSTVKSGTFITGGGILNKKMVSELLGDDFPCPLLEMESALVAKVAAKYGIPFLGIRAVSDPWDEELLFDIKEFCDDSLRIKPLKVLATIFQRPWIVPQLIRLGFGSRIAAASLTKVTALTFSRIN